MSSLEAFSDDPRIDALWTGGAPVCSGWDLQPGPAAETSGGGCRFGGSSRSSAGLFSLQGALRPAQMIRGDCINNYQY